MARRTKGESETLRNRAYELYMNSGMTYQEIAETIGVAISMNGGPGTVYGPRALAAFRDFVRPSEKS